MKPANFNLNSEMFIPKHDQSLLNLGPKYSPTNKHLPFMAIITSTQSCAVGLEYNCKENEAETLRQNVSMQY